MIDLAVTSSNNACLCALNGVRGHANVGVIGLYHENVIAIESEASDSLTFRSKRICA